MVAATQEPREDNAPRKEAAMRENGWIPTMCYQCKAECAILVRVQDGVIKEIRGNPRAGGKACVKGMSGVSLQYHPERLSRPLKRVGKRGEGRFAPCPWDEALDAIAGKLAELRDRGEAHTLTASFFPHSITDPKWRFLNAYGGFINTALPHCDSAKIVAFIKAMGGVPNHHIPPNFATTPKGGVIILAGRHAMGCLDDATVPKDILDARERGAMLVVIDPIFTADAAKADWWIPIRPSGDTALFTGMTHHIVLNDLYDKKFVENWVREGDFDKLKDYLADKAPEAMSAICDVPARDIVKLAELCAAAPSVGVDSFKGIMLGQALDFGHAWTNFLAVTGNIDNPGGQPLPDLTPLSPVAPVPSGPALAEKGWHVTGPDKGKFHKYSFIMEPTWYQAQAIKNGGLKMLITAECNPAITEMGQEEWRKAVTMTDAKGDYLLEMLVSYEIMPSETSKYADYVLPDKTYFERWELLYMPWWYNFGHGVALRRPVVEPLGECRHSNEVFIELGKRLCPEYFGFRDDLEYYDIQLAGLGLSVEKLKEMGGLWSPGTMGFRKYERAASAPPAPRCTSTGGPEEVDQPCRGGAGPGICRGHRDVPLHPDLLRTTFHQGGTRTHNNPSARSQKRPARESRADQYGHGPEAGRQGRGYRHPCFPHRQPEVRAKCTERIRPTVWACTMARLFRGRGGEPGEGVSDNILIPDSGMTLDWQDGVGGESHVSTRVAVEV
jgi:thiosulfate reductase/polysulfide reductase chain A